MRDRPARYITDEEARERYQIPGFVTYRLTSGHVILVERGGFAQQVAAGMLDLDRVIQAGA